MNVQEKAALLSCSENLINDMDVLSVLVHLRGVKVLTKNDFDRLNAKNQTTQEKAIALLDLLPTKDNSFRYLIEALTKTNQKWLAKALETQRSASPKLSTFPSPINIADIQKELKLRLKEDCEHIREMWSDFLLVTEMEKVYEPLIVIETNGTRVKNEEVNSYEYLTVEGRRIFLIEGDPGTGKTTYASKLALDWATDKDSYLKKFDFLFFYKCINIKAETSEAVIN